MRVMVRVEVGARQAPPSTCSSKDPSAPISICTYAPMHLCTYAPMHLPIERAICRIVANVLVYFQSSLATACVATDEKEVGDPYHEHS